MPNPRDFNYDGGFNDYMKHAEKEFATFQQSKSEMNAININASSPRSIKRELSNEDIHEMSTYHAPNPSQVERYANISFACESFLRVIRDNSPDSPDRSTAIRDVRSARMWANSAIANEGRF